MTIAGIIVCDFDIVAFSGNYNIDTILPIEDFEEVFVSLVKSTQYTAFPNSLPYNTYFESWNSIKHVSQYPISYISLFLPFSNLPKYKER